MLGKSSRSKNSTGRNNAGNNGTNGEVGKEVGKLSQQQTANPNAISKPHPKLKLKTQTLTPKSHITINFLYNYKSLTSHPKP